MKRHVYIPGGLTAYYAAYYAVVAVIVATAVWPGGRSWGINWYVYFTPPTRLIVMTAVLLLPLILMLWRRKRSKSAPPAMGSGKVFWAGSAAVMLLGALAFYFFKCETHFLGDGYLLISKLEGSMDLSEPSQYGSRQLQELLYSLLSGVARNRAQFVFRLISWGCGLAFLMVVLWAARRLFEANYRRFLFTLGVASGGYMLLFFGYVENYPPFVLGVTLFGLVGLLISRDLVGRWWLLVPLLLAGFFHVFTVVLLPAAVYLLLRETPAGEWIARRRSLMMTGLIALFVIVLGVVAYLFEHNYAFRFALVPPLQDIFTVGGYTLFSSAHLLDWINLFIMLVPALFFVPLLLIRLDRRELLRPDYLFLALMLAPCLVLTFLIDPKLGMPRDWDLFSFAGIPLTLLLYYGLLDDREKSSNWKPALLAVALGFLLMGPRVISQHDIIKSVNVFDRVTAPDILRTRSVQAVLLDLIEKAGDIKELALRRAEYEQARPDLAWLDNAIALGHRGRMDEAAAELRKVIAFNPAHSAAWSNLGTYFQRRDDNDSALFCLKVADGLTPRNSRIQSNLGIVYYSMGDLKNAERCWKKAIALDPLDYGSRDNLLRIYKSENRQKEYLAMSFEIFEIGIRRDAPLPFIRKLAELQLQRGDYLQAADQYRRALASGLDTAVVLELEQKYPQLHVLSHGQ